MSKKSFENLASLLLSIPHQRSIPPRTLNKSCCCCCREQQRKSIWCWALANIAVPYKLSFQRNDWFPIVPEYRHKMALCSHHQYPLCNRVHCHSLSPCQTKLWNWSIPGSAKKWIAPELNKNTTHTDPVPKFWRGYLKKGVFTSVPSKCRTLAPCLGAAQVFLGKMNLNTV